MAHFSSTEIRDMVRAIEERRAVCVSGPARSGLSRWTSDFVAERFEGNVIAIDGASLDSVEEVVRSLRLGGLAGAVLDPNRARVAHKDADYNGVIWISNIHLASRDALRFAARYLFTREGIAAAHQAVIIEGAIDVPELVAEAFPEGVNAGPLIALAEDGYPWRSLTEISDLAREIAPRLPALVIPWIVDLTGGDLALAREAINSLRGLEPEDVDNSALGSTWRQVIERSSVAKSIRHTVATLACDRTLGLLLAGRFAPGEHMTRCEDRELRALFFAGCLTYDRSARGYRIRSPITALLLLFASHGATDQTQALGGLFERAAIGARTAVVLLELARLELQLRATVLSSSWKVHAQTVTTPSQWKGAAKRATEAVMASSIGKREEQVAIAKVIRTALPDELPALDAARERASRSGAADDKLLDYLGLAEILAVAAKVGVLESALRQQLDAALVSVRNALAHFRGLEYEAAVNAVRLSAQVVRKLVEVHAQAPTDVEVHDVSPLVEAAAAAAAAGAAAAPAPSQPLGAQPAPDVSAVGSADAGRAHVPPASPPPEAALSQPPTQGAQAELLSSAPTATASAHVPPALPPPEAGLSQPPTQGAQGVTPVTTVDADVGTTSSSGTIRAPNGDDPGSSSDS